MVYQEMLCFPNLTVTANIFAGREITRLGRLRNGEMRERTQAPPAEAAPGRLARRACRIALGRASPAAPGRARARVRVPHPRPRRADDRADRRRSRPSLRRPARTRGTRRDAAVRVAPAARSLPAVRSHHGAARRRVRRARSSARVTADEIVRAMVGRELPRAHAARAPRRRRSRCSTSAHSRAGPAFTTSACRWRREKSSGCSGSSAPAGPNCSRRSSASTRRTRGTIRVDGRVVRLDSPRAAARAGIALVPEERQRQGLFFNLTVRHNLVLPKAAVRRDRPRAVRGGSAERRESLLATWRIKAAGVDVAPDSLSGGNQQKIVVAKWLANRADGRPARRADQGGRRRREVRDPRDHPSRGGTRRRLPRGVERSAGAAGAWPTASSSCAKGGCEEQIAGARRDRGTVMRLATHEVVA